MKVFPALLLAALLPLQAVSQSPSRPAPAPVAPAAIAKPDPRVELAARIPGARPEDLRATPVAGIYELTHGTDISYVSSDAKYIFSGDLHRVAEGGDFPNLSEVRRRELRARAVSAVPESELVVFGPKDAKYTITVFTDVDCPWCQRLHSEMAEYNKLGIRVRYMAWPRTGPATEAWFKAQGVWCATNRPEAFTRAVRGDAVKPGTCTQDPVARHYALGRDIGVRGTPGMLLPDGELVPGYVPAAELVKHLQAAAAGK